jgi:Tol biopolymer transport system component
MRASLPATAAFVAGGFLMIGVGGATASDRNAHTKIAFACSGDICLMNADGSGKRRLTRDRMMDGYPSWSPDGRRIAFSGDLSNYRGDRSVIEVMNADGSNLQRLTPSGGSEAMAAWAPDGTTLALDDNTTGQIDLVAADGSSRQPLTLQQASLPAWSPDGRKIAFVSGSGREFALTSGDIYLINVDGSGQRLLVRNGTFPAWSPDGRKIAFLRNKAHWSNHVSVWVMNADGRGQRRIWSRSAEGGGLSWSPDGTGIALTSDDNIWVINADGSNPRQLTRGWDVGLDPAWQPASDNLKQRSRRASTCIQRCPWVKPSSGS